MKRFYVIELFFIMVSVSSISRGFYEDTWESIEYIEDELDVFSQTANLEHIQRLPCLVDPQSVLDIIAAPPILLQDKLKQNFYLFTNVINNRSLLDLPCFLLSGCPCIPDWHFNLWYFYNQTSEGYFTKSGKNISSYLNLSEAFLIDNIEQFGLSIDLPTVFDLIGIMRIQQRRTGLMFGACKSINRCCLEWKTPVYYLENNFYLTPSEERRIKQALLFDDDNSNETTNAEFRRHVVSDQIGIGDTRFTAGFKWINENDFVVTVGGELTIPTALAFSKGLIGSNFKKNNILPYFDFVELFSLVLCFNNIPEALEQLRIFGESAFDKLAANLLQTSLGNNGHFGLIAYAYNQWPISNRFLLTTRGAIEYLLPKREHRLFLQQKDPALFDALAPYTTAQGADPAQAPAKLAFLTEQLFNTFFPDFFVTTIFPGLIVKLSTLLQGFFGENWAFGLGYDFWWQSAEKFGRISTEGQSKDLFNTQIAHRPSAYQNKVFTTITYGRPATYFDWTIGAYGDYTVVSSGIGQDFTLALKATFDL